MSQKIEQALEKIHIVKKWMVFFILILMVLIVAVSIVELAIILYQEIADTPEGLLFLDIGELLRIFGFVFMILIGFELMETIEMYFKNNIIHAEVVILIAVIAVSRKVILLDLEKHDPISVIGLSLIIVALGASYYFIKRANNNRDNV